jgi:hypothetical protein
LEHIDADLDVVRNWKPGLGAFAPSRISIGRATSYLDCVFVNKRIVLPEVTHTCHVVLEHFERSRKQLNAADLAVCGKTCFEGPDAQY